jgi:hypothetical protein
LILSAAQAGASVRRSGFFSSRRMAWGSAFAALAFVIVASMDFFSRGFMMAAATRPVAENQAVPAALQAADRAESGSGAVVTPASAPEPTVARPEPSPSEPQEKTGDEETAEVYGLLSATQPKSDACSGTPAADTAEEKCGVTTGFLLQPTPKSIDLPDFETLAPYLEIALGLAAALLAGFAVYLRRRR